jgi:superfamily II DNA or RNA helicase
MNLRDYQASALDKVRARLREGARSVLLVAPTGAGKGTIAAHVLRSVVERGGRALFLVHRGEILADVQGRLAAGGLLDTAILKAGVAAQLSAPVQLASVQTLASRGHVRPPANVVVWDEAHHAVAETYRQIREAYPDAVHLGLTATPQRADRSPLGDCFEQLVVAATPAQLRDKGFLVPCDVIAPPTVGEGGELALHPADAYQRWGQGRRCVLFAATVSESQAFVAALNGAGVAAEHLDGATRAAERQAILARLASGETRVVSNVFVLTEGVDIPAVEVCMLARGCQAESTFLQMVGRVLRPAPGKERALLIDLRGVVWQHGLPYAEREYTLDGEGITAREKKPQVWSCETCFAVNPRSAKVCQRCDAPKPIRIVAQEIRERSMQEIDESAEVPEMFKRKAFLALAKAQRERGYKPGWVGVQFKERFGHWPNWPLPGAL